MAVECGSLPNRKLKMFGFAVSGQGFYSIEIPDKGIPEKYNGLVMVVEGEATERRLRMSSRT
jgi:hypothetical protein